MKIPQPKSVQVTSPTGEAVEVAARDIVEHVVQSGSEFGQSRQLEKVRQGARILAALDGGDISADDLAALRAALVKPSRGWVSVVMSVDVRVPPTVENPTGIAKQKRAFAPSALQLLPLIDGLMGD